MSKIRVTMVDGSCKNVVRVGLARAMKAPPNPSPFFCV